HGRDGKGDGPLAAELTPPPRNFVRAEYHIRSTLPGSPPIDTDLIGTIARGMADTAMGRFMLFGAQPLEDLGGLLPKFARAALAVEVKTPPPGAMPMDPPDQLAARGRQVYDEARCADCHGKAQRGDGPSAHDLKGEGGRPAVATDLTKRWKIRSGGGGASD